MDEKLLQIEDRYEKLAARMESPETYADPAAYGALAKERRELEPVVDAWREVKRLKDDIAAAEDIPFDLPGYLLSAARNVALSPVFICCLLVVLLFVVLYAVGFRYDRAKRRIVRQRGKKRNAARK